MNSDSVKVSWIFSAMFMWITFLGFIPNFFPGEPIFLETYMALKIIHLITAVCFIVVTKSEEHTRIQFIQIFGLVYMLISVIGFMGADIKIGEQWDAVIRLNLLNYVQFSLGVALSAIGMILMKREKLAGSALVAA
jgi:hypothetical protein